MQDKDKLIDKELLYTPSEYNTKSTTKSISSNDNIFNSSCYPIAKNIMPVSLTRLKEINLNGVWNDNVYTFNGVSFTVNDDMSINVNGTATGGIKFNLNNNLTFSETTRIIGSGITTGGSNTYQISFNYNYNGQYTGGITVRTIEDVHDFPSTARLDSYIYIFNGATLNNVTFYPMLRLSNVLNNTYEPYQDKGCLYGLELYNTIEPYFITDNYYLNCGIISIFLALIILIVNAPFIIIRKVRER